MSATPDATQLHRKKIEFRLKLLLGGIFVAAGLGVGGVVGHLYSSRVAQIEQVPLYSASALRPVPVGSRVLVEGRISRSNETRFRDFVVYLTLEFRGYNRRKQSTSSPIWAELERVTPPLRLDLPGGQMQISNGDYALQSETIGNEGGPITWQDNFNLVWDQSASLGTRRYTGYEPDSPVLALGEIVSNFEPRTMRAEWIFGGTRDSYLASQRSAAWLMTWVLAPVFVLAGAVIIGLGVWHYRRPERQPAGKRTGKKRR